MTHVHEHPSALRRQYPRSADFRSLDVKSDLPAFDADLHTRKWCFIGLAFSYVFSIALLACGIALYKHANDMRRTILNTDWVDLTLDIPTAGFWYPNVPSGSLSEVTKEIIILTFNTAVTAITECLGYIHATSLRWALYHENRLHYNSNLRLFTSARRSPPNSWYSNGIWLFLLTVSYSCASQILPSDGATRNGDFGFNSLAVVWLAACLFTMSLLTTWALLPVPRRQIISWNSGSMNTTLALMRNTWSRPDEGPATEAVQLQPSIHRVFKYTRFIIAYLWVLVPLVCTAGVAAYLNVSDHEEMPWSLTESETMIDGAFFLLNSNEWMDNNMSLTRSNGIVQILFLAAVQIPYTLALHLVEQIVNLNRDETAWRRASKLNNEGGAIIGKKSTTAAFTTPQTLFLMFLKPFSHWLFGLSIAVDISQEVLIRPMPLFVLTGVATLLALFATFLACRRPKGLQPATYGNLKSLATFIDDWGEGAKGRLYFGDKGSDPESEGNIRLAGTSSNLEDIDYLKLTGVRYRGITMDTKSQKEEETSGQRDTQPREPS